MSEILKEAENLHEQVKQARPGPSGSSYDPTKTKTLDGLSAIIRARRKEVGAGIFKPREAGVVVHDFEATDRLVMDDEEANEVQLSDDEDQSPIDLDTITDLHQD